MEEIQKELLPVILMVMAFAFMGIGFVGIHRKKPFMMSSKWQAVGIIVALSPAFLTMISFALTAKDASLYLLLSLWVGAGLMMAILLRKLMLVKGNMAFGINDESFRHVLLTTLSDLGLSYQEQLSRLVLPDHNMQLRVTILSRSGTGHVSPSGDVKPEIFANIIRTMNQKFDSGPYQINRKGYAANLMVGVLLLVVASVLRV